MIRLGIVFWLLAAIGAAAANRPQFSPEIGAQLDLGRILSDSQGRRQPLSQTLGGRPALVIFGYDKCPNMCGVTQQAVAAELKHVDLAPEDYRALFISIDRTESPQDSRQARETVVAATDTDHLNAWRFLNGGDGAGAELAGEAGISFDTRPRIDQFVHPIAILALTPDGRISRVLPATTFEARDLRLALVEASQGKLGSIADRVFLLCSGFDPTKGQYTPAVWTALRLGCIATVLALGGAVAFMMARRRA